MKNIQHLILFLTIILTACSPKEQPPKFTFKEDGQGVEILEKGQPVFFYQRTPKISHEKYICNNYIHPLYSLSGDTLTEEFPEDHHFHRGIFWAWHQIYIDSTSVGDGWTMTDIEQEVTGIKTKKSGQLIIDAQWKSPLYDNKTPFISEETTITVHPAEKTYRFIDFTISLKAMVAGVEIGGADNAKGYGGFCARIRHQTQLKFTSSAGDITPQKYQITEGPWMDFSGPLGQNGETKGLTILCHPQTQNYPASWIIRNLTSMQNCVYPGQQRVLVPMDKPIKLFYRLIIHEGDAKSIDINKLQLEYEKIKFE